MSRPRPLVALPTGEQQAVLDAAVTGATVAISAAAGSGKTSALRMIAEARPKTRMLYLAFNKAIQVEADGPFSPNVTCKTAHVLAYHPYGARMRKRLNRLRMTGKQNAAVLGTTSHLASTPTGASPRRHWRRWPSPSSPVSAAQPTRSSPPAISTRRRV